jgi:NADPH2:quinone reductase
MEASGIVEAIGEEVDDVRVGDRVAYAGLPPGAYAEARLIPAHRLVKLPENIDDETAAAMMLQGMTARYLLHGCFAVGQGHTILIHAAACGVGLMVCQWANLLGAQVIGTVGSPQKAEVASAHGCHYPILYKEEDFAAKVKDITQGQGVDVVYDSIGQPTFMKSLTCLRPLGTMVSFGQSAGAVEPFDVGALAAGGSLFLTRPSLMNYTAKRKDLLQHAGDLFNVVAQGAVKVEVNQRYALKDAAKAHQDLEGRKTTGSSILIP